MLAIENPNVSEEMNLAGDGQRSFGTKNLSLANASIPLKNSIKMVGSQNTSGGVLPSFSGRNNVTQLKTERTSTIIG